MTRSYGKPNDKVTVAQRQKQELELLEQGLPASQLPAALGVSRSTVWRDLSAIEQRYNMELPEDFKKAMRAKLAVLEAGLASERMSARWKYLIALQIHDRQVKIGPELKLNTGQQPSTVINETSVTITAEAVEAYKRLKQEERQKLLTAGGGQ